MTSLVWRQYRASGAIAVTLLAALAALFLWDGLAVASHWHDVLVACAGNRACIQQQSPLVNGVVSDLPYLDLVVPVVLGMLWGAPLVAHEIESRTIDFAWSQSITRARWVAVKAGWLLLAAAACGAAISALTTWWSGPINAQSDTAFTPGQFDTQGIVAIGYAVFAMAFGIAAGALLRRTLPAIAIVLGAFIGLRLVISDLLRPHYLPAVTSYYTVGASFTPPGQAWILSQGGVSPTGTVVAQGWGELVPALPASCVRFLPPASAGRDPQMNAVFSCMQAHGWRGFITYQPGTRYWAFQGIETGIYVLLAAALIAVTCMVVSRRDA